MADYPTFAEMEQANAILKEQMALFEWLNKTNQPKRKPEPFLKWAGGKGQLLSQFESFFPRQYNRYYEPFLGSGAVFFHLQPLRATLNDVNPNLIAVYRYIQQQPDNLLAILLTLRNHYHALPPERQEQEYYRIRELYNQLPSVSIEKAAYFIFLNKTAYNGLYRENKSGGFNVPFGKYDNPAMFEEKNIKAVYEALQGVVILNSSFHEAVTMAQAGDFVYFDPPYMPVSSTASFTSYSKFEFGNAQQRHLAMLARQLAEKGVLVMLSNSDSDFIRELYPDFVQSEVKASRAINSKAAGRGKVTELVITSYKPL